MRRSHRGFQLIDLLGSVVILGIVLAIATPTYLRMAEQAHATRTANLLHGFLMTARVHAITRGQRVTICRSRDMRTCIFTGAWSAGTIAFEDHWRNNVRDPDEPIIALLQAGESGRLHVVGPTSRPIIGFNSDGRHAGTNLTLRICDPQFVPVRLVVVSVPGRIRTSREVAGVARCGSEPPQA